MESNTFTQVIYDYDIFLIPDGEITREMRECFEYADSIRTPSGAKTNESEEDYIKFYIAGCLLMPQNEIDSWLSRESLEGKVRSILSKMPNFYHTKIENRDYNRGKHSPKFVTISRIYWFEA